MYPGIIAQKTPDHPAWIMAGSGQTVTYGELDERSNRAAQLFWSLGLRPGDHIAFCLENHPRFFELCWAAQRSGLYFTAISSRLTPPEIEYIINDCGARVFISSRYMSEAVEALKDCCPAVEARFLLDGESPGWSDWEDALSNQPASPLDQELEGGQMLYSSGTTGRPKGVKHPLTGQRPGESLAPLGLLLAGPFGANDQTRYLSPAPLYHAAPLNFNLNIQRLGGTCIVMEQFDALEALRLIERHQATHSQWVPTMFVRMLKLPEAEQARFDVSSMQVAIHAAAPCPIPVKEKMIDWWGPVIYEYYAGTEGNGFCLVDSEQWIKHKGTVGQAINAKIHILDEAGEDLPAREIGGIYFESDIEFEYHNAPEKTAESKSPQGYTTLGDVGYVDEEGWLYLTDRKAHMIISGGVNVYPQEAENVLITHPKVYDVAVIGVPNEEFGEEVKAVVQPVDMAEANDELKQELIQHCRDRLSSIKCPRSVDFDPELPRHPTGKLYKRLLKDRYWTGRDSRIV
ncbi:MAG: acyl-CoA synthetase [Myxococcota bacterium]|nr:acyl-CoA synthetase [Myxococcota bacterium]